MSDPTFVTSLVSVPLDELRSRRRLCDDLDTELSYYRRLLHGRMDLLSFELRRRSGEETRSLIEALPEILADPGEAGAGASSGELSLKELPVELPDMPTDGRRPIDRILGDDFLTHLPSIDDEELGDIQRTLAEVETEISSQRRSVYTAYELVVEELTRRYREGDADVTELLQG